MTPKSRWVEYESSREHYGAEDLRQKAEFVRDALADPAIPSVLDLGCNTGEYSVLAANLGKSVVAADADDASIQRLYESPAWRGDGYLPYGAEYRPAAAGAGLDERRSTEFHRSRHCTL